MGGFLIARGASRPGRVGERHDSYETAEKGYKYI
jgi:hypothetical protein